MVCVPLKSNLERQDGPGNVLLKTSMTGLPQDSVANVSQVVAVDRELLEQPAGRLPQPKLHEILAGFDIILDR